MVITNEQKEEKTVNIYITSQMQDISKQAELYEFEVKRYTDLGYTINTFILPEYEEMPENVKQYYNKLCASRALIEDIVVDKSLSVLVNTLFQVVYQHIADFDKEDWKKIVGDVISKTISMSDETVDKIVSLNDKIRKK